MVHSYGCEGFPLDTTQLPLNNLAASITYAASRQTYCTIRLLADRGRVQHAYQAYAYFRWVDDCLDLQLSSRAERLRFVARQQSLLEVLSSGQEYGRLAREESMLAELIASDPAPESGLRTYLWHMMAVMAFDAQRRGRLVSRAELGSYTNHLAVAVTENLHYFIGHGEKSPHDSTRYAAVTAAHIAHMLRDTHDDIEAGYFNIPREVLNASRIKPKDIDHPAYRAWVRERVEFARQQFNLGYQYLSHVESLRCRIAGHSYISRFMSTLSMIEQDQYLLRAQYPARRTLGGFMTFLESMHASLFWETSSQPISISVPITESRKNP